jgi:hypothetical protein
VFIDDQGWIVPVTGSNRLMITNNYVN